MSITKIRRHRNSYALKLPPKLPPLFRCRSTLFSQNSRTAGSRSTRRRILLLQGWSPSRFHARWCRIAQYQPISFAIRATPRLGCAWKDGRVEGFVHFIKDGEKQVLHEAILATKRSDRLQFRLPLRAPDGPQGRIVPFYDTSAAIRFHVVIDSV
jgi:hypothetical protein